MIDTAGQGCVQQGVIEVLALSHDYRYASELASLRLVYADRVSQFDPISCFIGGKDMTNAFELNC